MLILQILKMLMIYGSGRLVRYSFEDGSQTAVNGFMNALNLVATMGTSDKFLGVAYIYIQMVFDAEKFGGGQPAISFNVKGKNVFDPRTGCCCMLATCKDQILL